MITKLPKEFLSVISHNNSLKQYLSNLSKGREFTPRSWLYEDQTPDTILDNWLERLDCLRNGNSHEQKVFQFDTSQLKKWGPQGGIKPISQLLQDVVLPTFNDVSPRPKAFSSKEWLDAQNRSELNSLGVYALRPASYSKVVADMRARDTLESNSGWPLFQRRNKPEVLAAAVAAAEMGAWLDYPAIALFRNYNLKTRLVWMFPEATNIVEGSYSQPVQSAIVKSTQKRAAFLEVEGIDGLQYAPWVGFDLVRRMVTDVYRSGDYLSASDFSSTDAHFTLHSTYEVFDVLVKAFQKEYAGGLRQSLERMHKIPLIIGTDEMITGSHGVASGSNWTNFVETVFDTIFGAYVEEKTDYNTALLCAIGDDLCWWSHSYDDALSKKLERLGKDVGQDLNAEKVTNDPDSVKYLQRLFQRGYSRPDGMLRGVYSTIRALKSSVYPERFHKPSTWSTDMFCARQFMILENCVDHPLFEEFVKYVVHGQRDLIPFAKKGAKELNEITRKTKLLPGFNPTYNQEKRDTSLSSFASIRIAASL